MSRISDLLVELQHTTGMTDGELALALSVSQPTFTRWRNGRLGVGERHCATIAVLAGRSFDEVRDMLGEQQPRPPTAEGGGETVADLLCEWADAQSLPAAALASVCGTSLSMYLRWRKAQVVPAAAMLEHLAEVVDVPLERMVMAWYRSNLVRGH